MSDGRLTGGCLCGAVRYEIAGEPVVVAICHCTMCRRAHAAPAVAWALFQEPQVRFTQGRPALYNSSPEATRGFCRTCGTQISFTASYIPGLIDISVGASIGPKPWRPRCTTGTRNESPGCSLPTICPGTPHFRRSPTDTAHPCRRGGGSRPGSRNRSSARANPLAYRPCRE